MMRVAQRRSRGSLGLIAVSCAALATLSGCSPTPAPSGSPPASSGASATATRSAAELDPATPNPTPPPTAEWIDRQMKMSFREFDQTPGQGWRKLADEQRWHDAGLLIDRYISYDPKMPAERLLVLNWHAGQMYGFAGETERAKERFAKAYEAPGAASPFNWNAYVRATIAFLDGDRAELEKCRAELAAGPTVEGVKPNLDIVDSLLRNFGSTYRKAYNDAPARPRS